MRPLALVTGASSGIGREIARHLANGGYDVALVARREGLLRELAGELEAEHGCKAEVVVADLSDMSQVENVKQVVEEVDVLVNNAGFGKWGVLTDQEEASVEEMVDVNIRALTTLTRHYAGKMLGRGKGRPWPAWAPTQQAVRPHRMHVWAGVLHQSTPSPLRTGWAGARVGPKGLPLETLSSARTSISSRDTSLARLTPSAR